MKQGNFFIEMNINFSLVLNFIQINNIIGDGSIKKNIIIVPLIANKCMQYIFKTIVKFRYWCVWTNLLLRSSIFFFRLYHSSKWERQMNSSVLIFKQILRFVQRLNQSLPNHIIYKVRFCVSKKKHINRADIRLSNYKIHKKCAYSTVQKAIFRKSTLTLCTYTFNRF